MIPLHNSYISSATEDSHISNGCMPDVRNKPGPIVGIAEVDCLLTPPAIITSPLGSIAMLNSL